MTTPVENTVHARKLKLPVRAIQPQRVGVAVPRRSPVECILAAEKRNLAALVASSPEALEGRRCGTTGVIADLASAYLRVLIELLQGASHGHEHGSGDYQVPRGPHQVCGYRGGSVRVEFSELRLQVGIQVGAVLALERASSSSRRIFS